LPLSEWPITRNRHVGIGFEHRGEAVNPRNRLRRQLERVADELLAASSK
jgi:hypothetical protein